MLPDVYYCAQVPHPLMASAILGKFAKIPKLLQHHICGLYLHKSVSQ